MTFLFAALLVATANDTGSGDFWIDLVLRLGFPVVVVLMLIKGYLVPGFIYDRVVKDNERLVNVFEEKALPALIKSNEVLEAALPLIQEAHPVPTVRRTRKAGA